MQVYPLACLRVRVLAECRVHLRDSSMPSAETTTIRLIANVLYRHYRSGLILHLIFLLSPSPRDHGGLASDAGADARDAVIPPSKARSCAAYKPS
jgi:hypothetical protein